MQLSLFSIQTSQTPISLEDLFAAYALCRQNKRYTQAALSFELDYETCLVELWEQIADRSYKPSSYNVFLVKKPVLREVFAADFRDRIVHHLIIMKLEPLFEKTFIYDSYACRKGRGTLFGIKRIASFIRRCSANYKKDCYILKLDVSGFFMHIDRLLLWKKLDSFIQNNYHYSDQASLLYLCKVIVDTDPVKNCVFKSERKDWACLPEDKSLFNKREDLGLPIGNLTSQVFANFYMNSFDHFIKHDLGFKFYGRYVDDFILINESKEKLIESIEQIRCFLKEKLFLKLHPKKVYLQHFSKGVAFLGAVIRPYHTLPGKRLTKGVFCSLDVLHRNRSAHDPTKEQKRLFLSSMNSYFGLLRQHKSFRIRKKVASMLKGSWKAKAFTDVGFRKFSLKQLSEGKGKIAHL